MRKLQFFSLRFSMPLRKLLIIKHNDFSKTTQQTKKHFFYKKNSSSIT